MTCDCQFDTTYMLDSNYKILTISHDDIVSFQWVDCREYIDISRQEIPYSVGIDLVTFFVTEES